MATRKISSEINIEKKPKTVRKSKKNIKGLVTNCVALNVRSEMNTDSIIIETVPAGSVLTIHEKFDGWFKVDGGYVVSDFISVIE